MCSISFEVVGDVKYIFLNNNYQVFKFKAYQALDKGVRINKIVKKIDDLYFNKLDI